MFENVSFDYINEAINLPLNCIFIAVPKTGTTSIRAQLRQAGRPMVPTPHLDIGQVKSLMYPAVLQASLSNNADYPSVDVPTDADVRAKADQLFQSAFKFASVRNPWARALSLYLRREGIQMRDEMTFDAFVDQHLYASDTSIHPTLHRNQRDWLCDADGTPAVDYVFRLDDIDVAISEIADRTNGALQLQNRHENRNVAAGNEAYRSAYTDRTRALIAKRFEVDIDHFKFTF